MTMSILRLVALSIVAAACASDAANPPVAPSNLAVSQLGAGAHLTWQDNSSDETEFVIMRQHTGSDPTLTELARVPFNATSFHDEPVTAGATYRYLVIATNDGGESESNEATFVAP